MPLRSRKPRFAAPGQLLLFDILNPPPSPEPGTILTPRPAADDTEQQLEFLFTPPSFDPPVIELSAPGPVTATLLEESTEGPHREPDPHYSADGAALVSFPIAPPQPAVSIAPGAEDHLSSPADFLTGPAQRFEANIAAIEILKRLGADGRLPTTDDRAVLARFSGFGDATFEPAFRLSAYREDERIWVERGQRLRSRVTDTEWESLERSRLNAFFTSPDVVEAIWEGLLTLGLRNLTHPHILKPAAGVGRFLGLQPTETVARSTRTAVELDTLTAHILKLLYPRTAVHNLGFQDAPIRDRLFDVAISNVPFGDIPVVDRAFLKPGLRYLTRAIHNYCFVKALAKLRPGGVLAFDPERVSVYEFQPTAVAGRFTTGAYTGSPARLVLDCFLLALSYDMCVGNVGFVQEVVAARRTVIEKDVATIDFGPNNPGRFRSVAYLPDRDAIRYVRTLGGTHSSPVAHEVTWFIRALPRGWRASAEAKAHARRYGVTLRPGETFVLPHSRGLGYDQRGLSSREIRSTHALAAFERAFLL